MLLLWLLFHLPSLLNGYVEMVVSHPQTSPPDDDEPKTKRNVEESELEKPSSQEAENSSSEAVEQMPSSSQGSQTTFTYGQLMDKSDSLVTGIDIKQIEAYLSEDGFQTVFGVTKEAFYKLPGKQSKPKIRVDLF